MSNFNSTFSKMKTVLVLIFCSFSLLLHSQIVSTYAGNGVAGYVNGNSTNAEFNGLNGIAVDTAGNVYVGDRLNNVIRKISTSGIVTTLAGNGTAGSTDGAGTIAEFNNPCGLAVDKNGNVYVADLNNNKIRKITSAGIVSTLAGNGIGGFVDGAGTVAEFFAPDRLTIDTLDNIYVTDYLNNRIRKVSPTGFVTTVAGNGVSGYVDGVAANAEFFRPNGIDIDKLGNIYVGEYKNNRVRKISNGIVTTVAGNGIIGHVDGTGTNAEFNGPSGLVVDKSGNIYINDEDGNDIRMVTPSGIVSTYAGDGIAGFVNGNASDAEFNNPRDIDIDAQGNFYLVEFNNNRVRKITPGALPITLLQFNVQLEKNSVLLSWQTATEINTSYFNIQRSNDGIHFNNLNKIAAAGNSSNIKNYTYTDAGVTELSASKLYYRLQEVDKDGKNDYSSIRTIYLSKGQLLFSVSPNPSKDFINIVSSYNVNDAQINITDMNGKTLFASKQNFVAGQQLKISISKFSSEILIVTIKSNDNNEQFKVIKE